MSFGENTTTQPDGQVGVIPGTVGVAGVAIAQLLGRDAVVVRFPASSGWFSQALLDQRASLYIWALVQGSRCYTWALVLGKVAVGVRQLSGKIVSLAARRNLLRVVGPLVSGFCVGGTGTPRHNVLDSVPRRSLRFSVQRVQRLYIVRRLCHCKVFR